MYKYDFSFIIPVYNSEKFLKRCINSVLKQKYNLSKIQIILVNDGSTDKSLDMCKRYKSDNIVVFNKKNGGVSSARNEGLKKCTGKYIAFLDSDDYISDNYCLEIYKLFESYYDEIDVVTFPLINFNNSNKKIHFRYKSLYSDGKEIYDINENPEVIQTTINICIKNKLKENLLFNEKMKMSEDEEYVTRNIMVKEKIGYCRKCCYYYRKNNDKSATKIYSVKDNEFNNYIEYYNELLKKYNGSIYVKNLFLNSLRWKINENKLIPLDSKNTDKYLNKIRELLCMIDICDILNLSFVSFKTKLGILELKGLNYKIKNIENQIQLLIDKKNYTVNSPIELVIKDFILKKHAQISGIIDVKFEKGNKNFIFEEFKPFVLSGLNTCIYKFVYTDDENTKKLDLTGEINNLKIIFKKKVYKYRYILKNEKGVIFIKRVGIKDIVRKLLRK